MPVPRVWARMLLLLGLTLYTLFSAGPFAWVGVMSLRTTSEISANPYGLPESLHWGKFVTAWTTSHYGTYFWNSTLVVVSAVVILTILGAMAAHCFARYRFRGNRLLYFLIFSAIIFPPQVTIISLFQVLVEYGLFNTRTGLTLVYVSIQLPLTMYILESFFAQIPQELYEAAKIDGCSDYNIFWRLTLPIGVPAIATTVILNFISLWNEFLYAVVLITDEEMRTLPLGIQKFMGDQMQDIGMIATGLMIAIVPVIVVYTLFSERLIRGMTAGAVKS
jgi:multiple sugar transport system permease protein/raffinose/stachyose/melibiose transport system permease protein